MMTIKEYLYEGLAVGIALSYINQKKSFKENIIYILIITVIYTTVFYVFDLYSPDVSLGARQGTGISIGILVIYSIIKKLRNS